jgi:hypothetical protein
MTVFLRAIQKCEPSDFVGLGIIVLFAFIAYVGLSPDAFTQPWGGLCSLN